MAMELLETFFQIFHDLINFRTFQNILQGSWNGQYLQRMNTQILPEWLGPNRMRGGGGIYILYSRFFNFFINEYICE